MVYLTTISTVVGHHTTIHLCVNLMQALLF